MTLTLLCPHSLPAGACSTCCDEPVAQRSLANLRDEMLAVAHGDRDVPTAAPYRTPDEYVAWIADRRAAAEMACGPEPEPDQVFADTQTPEPARVVVVQIGPGLLLAAIIVAVAMVWRWM